MKRQHAAQADVPARRDDGLEVRVTPRADGCWDLHLFDRHGYNGYISHTHKIAKNEDEAHCIALDMLADARAAREHLARKPFVVTG